MLEQQTITLTFYFQITLTTFFTLMTHTYTPKKGNHAAKKLKQAFGTLDC